MPYFISKPLSKRILFLGVSMKTKGGMTVVLASYDEYIENMRFIPTWKLGNKFVKAWYALQALIRTFFLCIFDKDIEIVHIHGAANASFYRCKLFIQLVKIFKKKVILHEHAADFVDFYNKATNKEKIVDAINICERLIVLSESWKIFFCSIGVERQKIYVLNNIVSPPIIQFPKREDNKVHLLFMGEISKRKGAFDLLLTLSENRDYFKDKLSVRLGGNEVDGDIRAFIKQHELSSFVSYEGWISGQKKVDCLNWEDIYILPSYNEGLPVAILEAMSYSHPVISTPVGGIPEVVYSGVNGMLIEPGNLQGMRDALKVFIERPDLISCYGKESFRLVQPYFPENVFKQLTTIYHSLLK